MVRKSQKFSIKRAGKQVIVNRNQYDILLHMLYNDGYISIRNNYKKKMEALSFGKLNTSDLMSLKRRKLVMESDRFRTTQTFKLTKLGRDLVMNYI